MAYIPGTVRSESLYGTSDGDSILGVGGHDTLWGYSGADVLRGGVGNDVLYSYYTYSSDSDIDRLYGDAGNDYLVVGGGDFAYGGAGRDTIEASGAAPAVISGDSGYDTLVLRYNDDVAGARISGVERLEGWTYTSSGGLAASQFSLFSTVGAIAGQTTAYFHLTAGGRGRIAFDRALETANIYGSDEAQTLTVTATSTTDLVYSGDSGASTIIASLGNDSLYGGNAADSLRGGDGNDVLSGYGSFGSDDGDADRLLGEGGNDYIYATTADVVYGGIGRDTIETRGGAPAYLNGGDGTDTLRVYYGDISTSFVGDLERLVAVGNIRMDADQFREFARIGADAGTTSVYISLQDGGTGTILFDQAIESATIYGTRSADEALRMVGRATPDVDYNGGSGRTLFEAGGGDDSLSGGSGADTLSGGTGNDLIENYSYINDDSTQDQLSGGDGNDTIYAGTDDVVDGGTGNDRIQLYGTAQVTAGDGHDFILGSSEDDSIDGGTGSDTVSYQSSRGDLSINLNLTGAQDTGGGGVDVLTGIENAIGGYYDDTIVGTAGANVLEGASGDDELFGGAGRDTASYSTSTQGVTADLRVAAAQQTGGAGIDLLSGFENLTGGSGNDSLYGDGRANVLIGGGGNDLLNGRLGFDTASYETATERVQISLAIRSAQPAGGSNGTDTLSNIEGLRGTAFDDGLTGDNGANSLAGLDGNDVLVGGAGADTVIGGTGLDRMRGGADADVFRFDRTTDSTWDDRDIILDFARGDGDRLDLWGIDARPLAGDQAFALGSAGVGGLSLVDHGADTLVLGNTDLDRDFEFALLIRDGRTAAASYTDADFIL